jgi:hypothetical protein
MEEENQRTAYKNLTKRVDVMCSLILVDIFVMSGDDMTDDTYAFECPDFN